MRPSQSKSSTLQWNPTLSEGRAKRPLRSKMTDRRGSLDEPLIYPEAAVCDIDPEAEHVSTSPGHHGPVGLNCAGFGSSVCVTASFGFAAASYVLRALAHRVGAR